MPCIERRPKCGENSGADTEKTPFGKIGAFIGIIGTIIGVITGVATAVKAVTVTGGILTIGGVAIAGAAGAGSISAALAGITMIIIIGLYVSDRCTQGEGTTECLSGVVREIIASFNSGWDELLPFTAMHNRVDIVVKSRYWDIVEDKNAKVFCTEHPIPRRSEIMRCYYFTNQVCAAAKGSLYGGIAGAAAGVIVGALVAAAIGCATIIFCLLALLVAAIVALVVVIAAALAGGQIAKAVAGSSSPTDASGMSIATGNLVSITGNMKQRDHDEKANVIYWVAVTAPHGIISSTIALPYSYCDLDEQIPTDACPRARG